MLRTPMLPAPRLSALTGAEVYVKYENLQVTNSFKERGALRQACLARRGRAQARRHRHVGRQSRPGGGLSRRAARDSGDHRHAGDYAVREGGGDQVAWRRSGARRRERGGGAGALRALARRARADAGASLRRCAHHRRAGHHRAGNAGGGRRPRQHRHPDRRRRADRRQRHRRARDEAQRSRSSAPKPRFIPSMWNALHNGQPADRRRDAGRRHRGQERRQAGAAGSPRTGRATSCWSTRRTSSARSTPT